MSSYKELILKAQSVLMKAGINKKTAKIDAEIILLYTMRLHKNDLITNKNEEISELNKNMFFNSIDERANKKPLAYITHDVCFFAYNFFVNESCLIPRVDSEIIVEQVLDYIMTIVKLDNSKQIKILDACCGSGCLGISVVRSLIDNNILKQENVELTLLDKSSPAIQVAKINLQKHSIKAKLIVSDLLVSGFGNQQYDIIICNPPYIETNIIETLDEEIKKFEPRQALDGGKDGLVFYRTIANFLNKNLTKNGKAFFEIGYNQGRTAKEIFDKQNFQTKIVKDYGKQDRLIIVSSK